MGPVAAIVIMGFSGGQYQRLVGLSKATGSPTGWAVQISPHAGLLGPVNDLIKVQIGHLIHTAQSVSFHGP